MNRDDRLMLAARLIALAYNVERLEAQLYEVPIASDDFYRVKEALATTIEHLNKTSARYVSGVLETPHDHRR